MAFDALRALAFDIQAGILGVPAVVTPSWGPPVSATAIWLPSLTEDLPVGRDFQKREPRRVLAFKVSEVAAIARGDLIDAAEYNGPVRRWKVDGVELQTAEQIRVIVVPAQT